MVLTERLLPAPSQGSNDSPSATRPLTLQAALWSAADPGPPRPETMISLKHPVPTADPTPGRRPAPKCPSLPGPGQGSRPQPSLRVCFLGSLVHLLISFMIWILLLVTVPETELARYKGNV